MSLFKKETKEVKKKPAAAKPASMKDMYADAPAASKKEGTASSVSHAYRVLVKPIISEKASRQQTVANQYSFVVAIGANKIEIAKAVKAAYGITPVRVNIVRVEGKSRRYGRTIGKRKDWKKAIVTLPAGKTIALHEGV
jgi:large subunit ribosomal protein L23